MLEETGNVKGSKGRYDSDEKGEEEDNKSESWSGMQRE